MLGRVHACRPNTVIWVMPFMSWKALWSFVNTAIGSGYSKNLDESNLIGTQNQTTNFVCGKTLDWLFKSKIEGVKKSITNNIEGIWGHEKYSHKHNFFMEDRKFR